MASPTPDPPIDRPLDIHLIAIGGTGMAPLACLLQLQGHRVRGSDDPLYPPMSTLLAAHGIRPLEGFDAGHLEPRPDLVVVGNAVPRSNVEVGETERLGLPRLSMPETLARFFLARRRPLVIAGTHGKTTTTSLAAWVYSACGRDPGYLIGGVPADLPASFALGRGERFVVEGDEYNAAYFDRGAKFLHYRPQTLILTSVEYDHADLYADPESLLAAYRALVRLLPEDGLLVACGDWPEVRRIAGQAPCRRLLYGLGADNELRPLAPPRPAGGGSRFQLADPEAGEITVDLPLAGEHNVVNALAVWAVARADGIAPAAVAAALGRFTGVRRRMEELGRRGGVTVVDDFAHHPTAVRETLRALRQRYPRARLVAIFEPRSLTAGREMFHEAYRQAFAEADRVMLAPIFHAGRLGPEERLDVARLARELSADGTATTNHGDLDGLLAQALAEATEGTVCVTMSSGSFGQLARRLHDALPESR